MSEIHILLRDLQIIDGAEAHARLAAELQEAEERGRRRGVEELDELRDALTQLLAWADHVAPRAGVRMNDLNTGARELARAALAPGRTSFKGGVSFRGGVYFDSQHKEIQPCEHGEWPMACWECQSEHELAKTPEQRAQEHKLRAALAPRDSAPKRDPYVEAGVDDWSGAPRDDMTRAPREDHDCGKQPGERESTCK